MPFRQYHKNHDYVAFLHLLICLNSAGALTQHQITSTTQYIQMYQIQKRDAKSCASLQIHQHEYWWLGSKTLVTREGMKSNTEKGMLLGNPQKNISHSRIYWFTDLCKSQCEEQFAAPFIVIRIDAFAADTLCKQISHITTLSWHLLTGSPCPYVLSLPSVINLKMQCYQVKTMILQMILPQVHLRKPCYDFSFL